MPERGERQRSMSAFALLSAAFEQPRCTAKLAEALSMLKGSTVELTIVEDDNPAVRTPLEWRQAIYEEKLAQARESIIADNNIQTLRRFSMRSWMKKVSAPFDRKHSLRSSSLT